ncbi:Reverse transcriptase domain [Trinorchestia longiramus]|nr:Reverse transcriptase domain [Trinorchestia longiramus]
MSATNRGTGLRRGESRPTSRSPLLPTPVQPKATSRPRPKLNTYRVQLKFIDLNITVERHKIFETTFGQLDAPLIRLTDTRTGFYAVTDEANTMDKLTSNKAIEAFKKLNLKPIIPPDLRARRSVFIRQIDYYIGSKNPEEIKEEIQRIQPWLKVSEVIKIKHYTHLLKIVTADTTIAQRILREGFKMFNTKITARQCEQETYTLILICYKCYTFESHPTHECRSTVQVCSECSSPDHLYTQCNNPIKKCINCNGAHRTLAASCPYRREVQKQKKIDEEQKEVRESNETYATVAKQAVIESKKIYSDIDNKNVTLLLLLDFSKAFDSVEHTRLLQKISNLGIATQWFQSYLANRSHAVRLENTISSPKQNDSDVPQGSILGPLLFSIFSNDFPSML